MAAHDHGDVPEHWHDEYLTLDDLKGWLSRWLIGAGAACLITGFLIVVWAINLEATVDRQRELSRERDSVLTASVEMLRTYGSTPLQSLRRELDSTRFEMQALAKELRDTRQALR